MQCKELNSENAELKLGVFSFEVIFEIRLQLGRESIPDVFDLFVAFRIGLTYFSDRSRGGSGSF
jgi:hypothetical protein